MTLSTRIARHKFREEYPAKHISPQRFQIANNFLTVKERLDKAKAEANMLLSSGELLSKRPPFEFRAHDALRSAYKGF